MAFTREEFHRCIRAFAEHSQRLHDRWQLIETHGKGSYLTYSAIDEQCLKSDFHVVYSDSYAVPVLYFNIGRLDGSLLALNDVWQLFQHREHSTLYETITQQEHPILHRPFFFLHPCHTENLFKPLAEQSPEKRFLLWLSIFGQSVGLPLSVDYAQSQSET